MIPPLNEPSSLHYVVCAMTRTQHNPAAQGFRCCHDRTFHSERESSRANAHKGGLFSSLNGSFSVIRNPTNTSSLLFIFRCRRSRCSSLCCRQQSENESVSTSSSRHLGIPTMLTRSVQPFTNSRDVTGTTGRSKAMRACDQPREIILFMFRVEQNFCATCSFNENALAWSTTIWKP